MLIFECYMKISHQFFIVSFSIALSMHTLCASAPELDYGEKLYYTPVVVPARDGTPIVFRNLTSMIHFATSPTHRLYDRTSVAFAAIKEITGCPRFSNPTRLLYLGQLIHGLNNESAPFEVAIKVHQSIAEHTHPEFDFYSYVIAMRNMMHSPNLTEYYRAFYGERLYKYLTWNEAKINEPSINPHFITTLLDLVSYDDLYDVETRFRILAQFSKHMSLETQKLFWPHIWAD
jgi:hypothetical protein